MMNHGEISGTTLAGLEFGQLEFVNEPNVSTPIQGSSSVVKDLHAYKASTICTCYNGVTRTNSACLVRMQILYH